MYDNGTYNYACRNSRASRGSLALNLTRKIMDTIAFTLVAGGLATIAVILTFYAMLSK